MNVNGAEKKKDWFLLSALKKKSEWWKTEVTQQGNRRWKLCKNKELYLSLSYQKKEKKEYGFVLVCNEKRNELFLVFLLFQHSFPYHSRYYQVLTAPRCEQIRLNKKNIIYSIHLFINFVLKWNGVRIGISFVFYWQYMKGSCCDVIVNNLSL